MTSSVSSKTNGRRRRTYCDLSKVQIIKILGSLVIGVFTIVTTIQQYQVNDQNRWKDLEIASRQRDQEQKQANTLQQETVYAVYIKEMDEFSLKLKTNNLSSLELDHDWRLARAKTLSAVRQLDTKRKSYLIQFLYEGELLFSNRSAIDLGGSDLSEITLTGHLGMEFIFDYIALTHVVLSNTSFFDLHIMKANFSKAYLYQTNFTGCDLRNADLRGVHAQFAILRNVNLSGAIIGDQLPDTLQNAILPNGSYVFYNNNSLPSNLFDSSVNLIINEDANCPTNINSTEIFAWEARSKSVAIITKYSELPSFTENITRVFFFKFSNFM